MSPKKILRTDVATHVVRELGISLRVLEKTDPSWQMGEVGARTLYQNSEGDLVIAQNPEHYTRPSETELLYPKRLEKQIKAAEENARRELGN